MHQGTQGAEERDNKAEQVLREARETRQVVEQVSTGDLLLRQQEKVARWAASCKRQVSSWFPLWHLLLFHLLICQQVKKCHTRLLNCTFGEKLSDLMDKKLSSINCQQILDQDNEQVLKKQGVLQRSKSKELNWQIAHFPKIKSAELASLSVLWKRFLREWGGSDDDESLLCAAAITFSSRSVLWDQIILSNNQFGQKQRQTCKEGERGDWLVIIKKQATKQGGLMQVHYYYSWLLFIIIIIIIIIKKQVTKQGGLMQVPLYPANHHFRWFLLKLVKLEVSFLWLFSKNMHFISVFIIFIVIITVAVYLI